MIKFFDMFAGVGGFRAGLTRAGGFECIGHCEIDKYADAAYRRLHNIKESEVFYEDATKINTDTMPDFDLLCAGFPCQSFSIAGKRKGFNDARGTMFFEIAKVAREKRPAYLLLENVPGLLSHDEGRTFSAILAALCQLGYCCEWQVLNSKDFGVPQSRRRVYIICYLDARCAGKVLPFIGANPETLVQLEGESISKCKDQSKAKTSGVLLIKEATKCGFKQAEVGDSVDISFMGTHRGRVGKGIAHTLNTSCTQCVVEKGGRIRRLTPRECFRLQGFYDDEIDKLLENSSDTQAYKQAGNAVTVNVVHAIALRLKTAHGASVAAAQPRKAAA